MNMTIHRKSGKRPPARKESKMSVKNLSFEWNGLFTGIEMNRIPECHFVHFFLKDKLPNNGENVEELMKYVG